LPTVAGSSVLALVHGVVLGWRWGGRWGWLVVLVLRADDNRREAGG
jgi:hypothetical protein